MHALMKPKPVTRGRIEHTASRQPWPIDGRERISNACEAMAIRLGIDLTPAFPTGDFHFVLILPGHQWGEARAIARVLSRQLPGCWLNLDRHFVRGGILYVRERGFKLTLRKSSSYPVPRMVANKLKGLGEALAMVRQSPT